ncbi:glycoside hydrolase family 5 protein [Methylobacterium organophilum]|uniref:Endoglucanase 3 n=1 Tax=Methylobacterium organophilum TaxID=410 RepID=A0ABQ4TE96_METOR|nr:cellulase family glycosylhydrolase [Methylobacterium organophilum]GJE28435.1 Endoglucanase 3 [Methylobacterium organophilum]
MSPPSEDDRPTRRGAIAGALACAALPGSSPGACAAPEPIALRRGVNLWPWFALTREYPPPRTDYGWPAFQPERPVPTRQDLARLAASGLDFVRLPVDPGPFLAFTDRQRDALFAELDGAVDAILGAGLSLVLNVHANGATHHYNPAALYGSAQAPLWPDYRAFVAALAARFGRRGRVALEPVNEPPQGCGAAAWDALQRDLLAAARAASSGLTLVATGACGSMVPGLLALDPKRLAAFAPLLYDVHFYEPYLFSHQGASWMREPVYRALNAVPWPGSAGRLDETLAAVRARMAADTGRSRAEKAAAYRITEAKMAEYFAANPDRRFLDRYLSAVRGWADTHGLPPGRILMGEFGALRSDARYVAAKAADRARYVRDVRESAESFGFAWAFWNLFDGMGLIDDTTRAPDAAIFTALGLRVPSPR